MGNGSPFRCMWREFINTQTHTHTEAPRFDVRCCVCTQQRIPACLFACDENTHTLAPPPFSVCALRRDVVCDDETRSNLINVVVVESPNLTRNRFCHDVLLLPPVLLLQGGGAVVPAIECAAAAAMWSQNLL